MRLFTHCKTCEVLKQQNEYLQGIIDRLLIKNGVTPIPEPEPEKPETEDVRDKYGE